MTGTSRAGSRNNSGAHAQSGFTYIGVLVVVVVIGIMAQTAVMFESHRKKVDLEAELLFRGQAYMAAIRSYYEIEKPANSYPRSLDQLLYDPRFSHRRHIRKLYDDPITGGDWVVIRGADGGISGVVSSSEMRPIKQANWCRTICTMRNCSPALSAGETPAANFNYRRRRPSAAAFASRSRG